MASLFLRLAGPRARRLADLLTMANEGLEVSEELGGLVLEAPRIAVTRAVLEEAYWPQGITHERNAERFLQHLVETRWSGVLATFSPDGFVLVGE